MNLRIIGIVLWIVTQTIWAQNDTLRFDGMLRIGGSWQTGNLDQIGGNLMGQFNLENNKIQVGTSLSYSYVTVNEFNVINDSWNYVYIKPWHKKKVYPLAMLYGGFAKSFGMDRAWLGGIGGGINIVNKSKNNYLNFNLIAGYMDFGFTQNESLSNAVTNAFLKANFPLIKEHLIMNWEAHAYVGNRSDIVYGIQNNIRLLFPLTSHLNFSLGHLFLYNTYVDEGKENLNTLFTLGINARFQ